MWGLQERMHDQVALDGAGGSHSMIPPPPPFPDWGQVPLLVFKDSVAFVRYRELGMQQGQA